MTKLITKPRDPSFVAMTQRKKGAHVNKKQYTRKIKHKGMN